MEMAAVVVVQFQCEVDPCRTQGGPRANPGQCRHNTAGNSSQVSFPSRKRIHVYQSFRFFHHREVGEQVGRSLWRNGEVLATLKRP